MARIDPLPPSPPRKPNPALDMSEDEIRRLIGLSGAGTILKSVAPGLPPSKAPQAKKGELKPSEVPVTGNPTLLAQLEERERAAAAAAAEDADEPGEVFQAMLLIIPFSFLYLLMDLLVRLQYGETPTVAGEAGRMAQSIPLLSIMIFYSSRHLSHILTTVLLFFVSLGSGIYLIHLINHGAYGKVIQSAPPLGTLWVYTVVQLDLKWAVAALVGVGAWVWKSGEKIVF